MANISNQDIARVIFEGAKEHHHEEDAYAKRVVKFLAQRKLISKSHDILLRLQKIIHEADGVLEAKVSSAFALNPEDKKKVIEFLKQRYKMREVILQESIDRSLLNGFKLEVGDEIIDLSMKEKISKLKEHLTRRV